MDSLDVRTPYFCYIAWSLPDLSRRNTAIQNALSRLLYHQKAFKNSDSRQ